MKAEGKKNNYHAAHFINHLLIDLNTKLHMNASLCFCIIALCFFAYSFHIAAQFQNSVWQ